MGTSTLSKTNRLFWLGRYVERAFIAIEVMEQAYDVSLDGPAFDYEAYCARLNIPCRYEYVFEFLENYLFNPEDPNSATSSLNRAFDNAVVLRETLSSTTLSYIQMAKNVMDNAVKSPAPMLDLQTVKDYLMAFKGCVDEYIADEDSRMVVKVGFTLERISMYLRLEYKLDTLDKEFDRLASRLRRTRMPRDGKQLRLLIDLTAYPNTVENKDILLECVEALLPDSL